MQMCLGVSISHSQFSCFLWLTGGFCFLNNWSVFLSLTYSILLLEFPKNTQNELGSLVTMLLPDLK